MSHMISNPAGTYLARLISANMNSTADQAITVRLPPGYTRYLIRRIICFNPSLSLTTSVGGIYTAASKGGDAVVAAAQVFSGLTGATKSLDLTLAGLASTDIRTETTLYLSLTVAQGVTATADIYFFADILP